jgi:hypothetical protein
MTSTRSALLVNHTTRKISIEKPTRSNEEEAEYQIPNNNLLMQPIESIKAISYLGKIISKNNTRRQTKGLTQGFSCRSLESPPSDPYVFVEEA